MPTRFSTIYAKYHDFGALQADRDDLARGAHTHVLWWKPDPTAVTGMVQSKRHFLDTYIPVSGPGSQHPT